MFGRRTPITILNRLKLLILPVGGWRRQGSYIAYRIKRLPGSPARIAAGFACGVAVSFTPFIGFHFLLAAGLALLLRGNILASAFGTVAGNPWTFPFIWIWTYKAGLWLLGGNGQGNLPDSLSFQYIFDRPLELLWPMFVGSLPTGLAAFVATFIPILIIVSKYQGSRRQRLRWKVRKRMEKLRNKTKALSGKSAALPAPAAALGKPDAENLNPGKLGAGDLAPGKLTNEQA